MSSHVELMPASALNSMPATLGTAGGPQQTPSLDPYRIARRALRGRYLIAVLLGLLGGTIGAMVGWKRGGAVYRSEGLIQIAYSRPSILRPADQSPVPLEVIQVLLQSQQAVLSSRRLVDLALREPEWVATGRGASPAVVGEFASNLKVEYRFNTDYLRVLYTDREPTVAAAAVQSIIHAYVRLCNSQDNHLQQQRLQALQSRRGALAETLDQLHRQIEAITREVGPADIDRLQEATVTRVATLQSMLTDIGMALILAQGQKTSPLTHEQIAVRDPAMRDSMTPR
ncbi:MAG TPA: hypothetical protein VHP11_04025, partial [Tepidisphaeraceae bacterium]|nr:hypothetical protein [Tepidisphaeraceae bacterium]